VVKGIEPTTSGLLDRRRSRSANHAPHRDYLTAADFIIVTYLYGKMQLIQDYRVIKWGPLTSLRSSANLRQMSLAINHSQIILEKLLLTKTKL